MDEEMERVLPLKGPRRWRGRLITVLFAVMTIIFLILLVLVPALYIQLSDEYNEQFGVVFSMEANHTVMNIYQWDGRKRYDNGDGVMVTTDTGVVQCIHQCYISYGVISFAANISLVRLSLQECLSQVVCSDHGHHDNSCIPSDRIATTKAFLGATDSMRLLRHREPTVTDKILDYSHEVIKKTFPHHERSFILSYEQEDVATIVGWNEKIGTLPPTGDHQLYGVVIMGELSSHVILGDQLLFNGLDHMRQVSLYNNNYTIHSKIDHCYGWNESLRMLSANLSLSHPATPTIDQPCLPRGYIRNITAGELFIDPCTNWSNPYDRDHVISFTGTANGTSCRETVNNKLFSNFPSPVINHSSSTTTTISAFSYYYEVMKMFNISDVNDDDNGWSMMEHRVMSYCNLSWHQIVSSYGDIIDERLLFRLCYDGTLVYTLLQYNGFIPTDHNGVWNIHREQYEVPWPRGMMVEKTGNIRADPLKDRPFSDTVLVIGLLTFALLTILFLFLLTFALRNICRTSKHYNNKNGYIQISHD